MNQHQQRRFDALLRVQQFLDTNASDVGTLAASAGRKELDAAVSALTDCADIQGSANLTMAGQINHERFLEVAVRNEHMKPIATFARARLRGVPEIAALSKRLDDLHGARLVRAARSMASAAEPHADAFTAAGLPSDTVGPLGAAADALQAALTARASSKVGRIAATKAVSEQVRIGCDAVSILHAIVSKQFAGDPIFLAGWDAARRIGAKKGALRGAGASVGDVTPIGGTPAAVVAA